jgi:hypothetical protein
VSEFNRAAAGSFFGGVGGTPWEQAAKQVLAEGAKQHANDGKITNASGLLFAMVPSDVSKVASSGWRSTFNTITTYKNVIGAGLSTVEKEVRGKSANSMDWMNVAVAAIAGPSGLGQYTNSNGSLNWKGIVGQVAVRGAAALIVGDRRGEDESLNFLGSQIGNWARAAVEPTTVAATI